MPARPFCKLALRSRSRFRLCRSAAFSRLCRWLGDSFSRERFAEDVGMVGRVFWGFEGCNAGSMDTVARQFIGNGRQRPARRSTNDQDNH
jgi:hypothetical protein